MGRDWRTRLCRETRYGSPRLNVLLRREGWMVNHKRVERLYGEEGLAIRTRVPRRRKNCRIRTERPRTRRVNDCWSMDFVADELFNGRRLRALTIVDNFTRESLAIDVAQRVSTTLRCNSDTMSHQKRL
ncbi:MAG: transposase [Planctomycetes bacterium]|nr:transposase [Planctomycetota bacterium]